MVINFTILLTRSEFGPPKMPPIKMCQYKKEACSLTFLQIHFHMHIGHRELACYPQQSFLEMHIKTFSLSWYDSVSFISIYKNFFSAREHKITDL